LAGHSFDLRPAVLIAAAVWQFSGALETRLRDSDMPTELVERLVGDAAELAELKAPDGAGKRAPAIVPDAVLPDRIT
jgi:hypothetical protein